MIHSLSGQRALLIGGHGGIGAAIGAALLRAGASEVIATSARRRLPQEVQALPGLLREQVDVADLASVRDLAQRLAGQHLHAVINCAGVNGNQPLGAEEGTQTARREMDVNYFGLLHLAEVFGPVLAAQEGGGRFMTLLSFLSHVNLPAMATYCASKAAAHSALQAIRARWATAGVRVCGVYPMAVDTSMSRDVAGSKLSPEALATEIVRALAGDDEVVYPGDARAAFAHFLAHPLQMQREMAGLA